MAVFWKPGTVAPGSDVDRESGVGRSDHDDGSGGGGGFMVPYNPNAQLALVQQRERLPIYQNRLQLLYLVETTQVVVIVGQTGCGKTTQIPQYLREARWTNGGRMVACTQPRRVAATSVAQRVAEEMGTRLGDEVGYSVRFEEEWTPGVTKIKYMTDGMLLREMLIDPLLTSYSVVMLDEAHERSLHTDIIIGLMKKVLKKRPDLRVVISSATLDAELFFEFFERDSAVVPLPDNAPPAPGLPRKPVHIMSIEGRMYPVEINYLRESCMDYVEATIQCIIAIHEHEPPGDVLVFLTGQEEIETVLARLKDSSSLLRSSLDLVALPIYAGLGSEDQLKIFQKLPRTSRKVVVATNIAESSITIDGIVYVVDCGFVKIRAFNPRTAMESLVVVPVSKASALQRAGRAGRVRPGKVFRLYTEETYQTLADNSTPEMQRSDLSPIILQLKAMGISNVLRFDFMSSPPAEMMIRALEELYAQGALNDQGELTYPLGMNMAEFPVDPKLAKILLVSGQYGCSEEIATIAAMISVQSVFVQPAKLRRAAEDARRCFSVKEGDHLTLLNVFKAFQSHRNAKWSHTYFLNNRALNRVVSVRKQLVKYLKRFKVEMKSCGTDDLPIRRCLTSGYFANAARRAPDGSYKTVRDNITLHIHPASALFKFPPECVIFHEVVETTKAFMREVTTIDELWLAELAPHFYETKERKLRSHQP